MDTLDMARQAEERGMRGFAHKTHMDVSSAAAAYYVRKIVPEIEAFGRFVLNLPTGGLNPAGLSAITFNSFDAGNTGGSLNDDVIDGDPNQVDILEPGDIAYFTSTYTVHQLDVDQLQ